MAAVSQKHVQLALGLPQRLLTFLARYPPATILPADADPEKSKTGYQQDTPNPFLAQKHPVTGRWHDPKYSLRRQAELVKIAREHGIEELLPYTPKKTEERIKKRVELGLRVKGTGVGQKVKGHKHERQLVSKYDGEEERGHARDAQPYSGMEEGPPSYYDILNLSPSAIEDAHAQGGASSSNHLIKRAYRRALLSHHPDKQQKHHQATKSFPQRAKSSSETDSEYKYTIDQISQAYAILSSPSQRAIYDSQLKLLHLNASTNNGTSQDGISTLYEISKTGIENVDLDDLDQEEDDKKSEAKWYRPCRCGNPRGYLFSESDLEEASDLGELMVGCADCSLWLRVHFAVLEEEEEEENSGKDEEVIGKDRLGGQDGGGEDGNV
ncbi:hypothetical protein V8F33_000151 [Rhypophila sp. PSN 637]